MRSSEAKGFVNISLTSDGSSYSKPSFIKGVVDSLFLLADYKRFLNIDLVQIVK